jgi:hypothetical protein
MFLYFSFVLCQKRQIFRRFLGQKYIKNQNIGPLKTDVNLVLASRCAGEKIETFFCFLFQIRWPYIGGDVPCAENSSESDLIVSLSCFECMVSVIGYASGG